MILYDTIKHQKMQFSTERPTGSDRPWPSWLAAHPPNRPGGPGPPAEVRSTELEITLESLDIGTMLGYTMI